MRRINKILIAMILISSLLLGIGYSAIENITLDIEGTASATATWKTLETGESFNKMLKDSTSTSTSDTTITKIVFDYWSEGYSEDEKVIYQDSDWESGTAIDEDGEGKIKLFKSSDGIIAYILSRSNIMANKDCRYMFENFVNVTEVIFNNFDTSNTTKMSYMFSNMSQLKNLNLSNFNTSEVTEMTHMFQGATSIQELNLNSFDTRKVDRMSRMFASMTSLTKLEISSFISQNVHGMHEMFYNCNKLTSLDLSGFQYTGNENVNLYQTFYGMTSLTYLDLRNYDFSKVTGYWNMFYNVPSTIKVIVKDETARQWLQNTSGAKLNSETIVLVSEL